MHTPENETNSTVTDEMPAKVGSTGKENNQDSCSGHDTGKCCGNHRSVQGCCGK
jgi:hypothetical protein